MKDENVIVLSPEAYDEFVERLNRPPRPCERLKKLLQTPAPWDNIGNTKNVIG
jgi:uncharacterized protein (DUF1778 family)